jgi:hypothetical protein
MVSAHGSATSSRNATAARSHPLSGRSGQVQRHRHSVFGDAEKTTFAPMDFWRGYAARAGQLRSQGLQAMIRLHPEEGIRVHEEGAVVAWLRCINPVISTGFE